MPRVPTPIMATPMRSLGLRWARIAGAARVPLPLFRKSRRCMCLSSVVHYAPDVVAAALNTFAQGASGLEVSLVGQLDHQVALEGGVVEGLANGRVVDHAFGEILGPLAVRLLVAQVGEDHLPATAADEIHGIHLGAEQPAEVGAESDSRDAGERAVQVVLALADLRNVIVQVGDNAVIGAVLHDLAERLSLDVELGLGLLAASVADRKAEGTASDRSQSLNHGASLGERFGVGRAVPEVRRPLGSDDGQSMAPGEFANPGGRAVVE